MNVKGVDLQFAIHKNDEAGLKQNQLMQRPINDQALLGHEANQALQKERTRAGKVNESAGKRINADQEEKEQSRQDDRRQGTKRTQPPKPAGSAKADEGPKHPYKGRHIDLTL
jgi:hypothetical protein